MNRNCIPQKNMQIIKQYTSFLVEASEEQQESDFIFALQFTITIVTV